MIAWLKFIVNAALNSALLTLAIGTVLVVDHLLGVLP
jgi:hypothetical protein